MTDAEKILVSGFDWMRTVMHENNCQPARQGEGRVSVGDCTARACVYAAGVLAWAKEQAGG